MSNLLIALGSCADDAPAAERLLDWVYHLGGKVPSGHILLAFAHDVHQEMRLKIRISAELAFESVSEFQATKTWLPSDVPNRPDPATKVELINNLWEQTANHIAHHYRWPWLWLEPDCVPLAANWMTVLADAYANQPRKFMGGHLKRKIGNDEALFLSRISVYHAGAYNELRKFAGGSPPFEWGAGPYAVPRSTKSRLIQNMSYDGDFSKVRPDAVLLHSDKTGGLIEYCRNLMPDEQDVADNGRGEPVEVVVNSAPQSETPLDDPVDFDPEPQDRRTRAWKEWKARQMERVG